MVTLFDSRKLCDFITTFNKDIKTAHVNEIQHSLLKLCWIGKRCTRKWIIIYYI